MGIYRGAGGSGDAVNDASSEALITIQARDAALAAQAAAEAAQAAAELAETNAETAETNAETAETNAETAATNAASSASAASTSASNAATSATNAANSATAAQTAETNAETAETNAAASASAASTSASNAATSATNASNSASAAATSATNASNSASAAATSATNAANSATAAQTAQTAAELAETNAETAETNAETAETNAAASASAAANSASNASTSASNAATSATNASNSASAAATSATNASNSASAASTSATNASNSATSAANSATAAAASYDSFDDRYLGAKSSAPTLDNDGNTLLTGALYYDTVSSSMKVWSGSAWLDAYASLSGALLATNNLSDLNNTTTARTNLGLGSIATQAANNVAVTGGSINGTTVGASTPSTGSFTSLTDSGNLTFTGTGNRITGDFSNATIANRVAFQTSTTNGNSNFGVIPNGTAGIAALRIYNNSDPTNASEGNLAIVGSTDVRLQSSITGTGTYLPLTMYTGGSERLRIDTSGNVGIGTSSPSIRLDVSGTAQNLLRLVSTNTESNLRFDNSGATTNLFGAAGANFYWYSGSTERMRLDSSGNLCIGSTSAGNAGTINVSVGSAGTTVGGLQLWSTTNSTHYVNFGDGTSGTDTYRGYVGYAHGSDSLLFGTSTAERMRIDSSGNVLIGNSTDSLGSNKLFVQSAGTGNNNRTFSVLNTAATSTTPFANRLVQISSYGSGADTTLHFSDQALYNAYIGMGSGALYFATNGANERMRIDASGYVLAGTTSNAPLTNGGYSGGAVFAGSVSAGLVIQGSRTADGSLGGLEWYNGSSTRMALIEGRRSGANNSSVLDFYAANAGSLVQAMRIDSSGNVGIGTSSPQASLHVSGAISNAPTGSGVLAGIQSDYAVIHLNGSGATGSFIDFSTSGTDSKGRILYDNTNNYMKFDVNATERMRIDSSGNVGIGTTSPGARLHASGGAIVVDNDWSFGFGSTRSAQIVGSSSTNFMRFETSGTERMRIDSSGRVGVGTSSPASRFHVRSNSGGTDNDNDCVGQFVLGDSSTFGSILFVKNAGNRGTRGHPDGSGLLTLAFSNATALNVDKSGNLAFDSGYGSAATAYGCRAWVRFNGTGTISINASGNVSSLTDNGTGDYTINFTNAMPDANYSMAGTAQSGSATRGGMASPKFNGTYSTSAVQVFLADSANAFLDSAIVGVQIFR